MKTVQEVAQQLQEARGKQGVKLDALVASTGLTAVTLRGLLTGRTDSRLSTVLATAHELGLELMLVPSAFSASIAARRPAGTPQSLVSRAVNSAAEHESSPAMAQPVPVQTVQSFIDRAIGRSGGGQGADAPRPRRRAARKVV
jgi:hypothetical protein